jgi:tRNA(adenine34) deaminase
MFNKFMQQAIDQANLATGEVPVGAVIIDKNGNIVGRGKNQMITKCDPTAHAEIEAIRDASANINQYRLTDCSIYVTLEPCQMCMFAIKLARIKNVYIGATNKLGSDNHNLDIYDGIMENECSILLNDFFKNKRN